MQRTLVSNIDKKTATHAHTKMQRMHAENRIDACVVFFACIRCVFRFFDCVASRASVALRVAYNNLETVCRPTQTDLKVGFQSAVRNATEATHAGHATQIKKTTTHAMHAHEKCNGRKDRIGSINQSIRKGLK